MLTKYGYLFIFLRLVFHKPRYVCGTLYITTQFVKKSGDSWLHCYGDLDCVHTIVIHTSIIKVVGLVRISAFQATLTKSYFCLQSRHIMFWFFGVVVSLPPQSGQLGGMKKLNIGPPSSFLKNYCFLVCPSTVNRNRDNTTLPP